MTPFAIIGIFISIAVVAIIASSISAKKRRDAWQSVAQSMGFEFLPNADPGTRAQYDFKLFKKGHGRRFRNTLRGETRGTRVTLSDYRYTTRSGSGKNRSSKTHQQTICVLEKAGFNLPRFFLRRQSSFFDWLGKAFGGQDIDFDEDPEFSKAYVLQGDENFVRDLFSGALRTFLMEHAGTFATIEADGDALMVNYGKGIKPEECAHLLELVFGFLSRLR